MPSDFTLPTDTGEMLSFDETLRSKTNTLLFFYRGWWWLFCRAQVGRFRELAPRIEALNLRLILISADSPASNQGFRKKMKIDFALLSDEDHAIADVYKIPIQRVHPKAKDYQDGFIQPAVFIFRGEEEIFTFSLLVILTTNWFHELPKWLESWLSGRIKPGKSFNKSM